MNDLDGWYVQISPDGHVTSMKGVYIFDSDEPPNPAAFTTTLAIPATDEALAARLRALGWVQEAMP